MKSPEGRLDAIRKHTPKPRAEPAQITGDGERTRLEIEGPRTRLVIDLGAPLEVVRRLK